MSEAPWKGRVRQAAGPLLRVIRSVRDRRTNRELTQWLRDVTAPLRGLTGKVVLDVGTDLAGNLVRIIDREFRPREIVGLNLAARNERISATARLESADIRHTGYPDATFDVILSSSAFEHITGLEEGMTEMHRILKPGGFLFTHFGPIWSTSYGHHLWTTHRGRLYTYWNVTLPPFCHLLMSREEIAQLLRQEHDAELSGVLSEYVTSSPEQNQLFFEDYEEIFRRSPFEILLFKGYDHPGIAPRYNRLITAELLERLQSRYPGKTNFFYDGITALLRKRV